MHVVTRHPQGPQEQSQSVVGTTHVPMTLAHGHTNYVSIRTQISPSDTPWNIASIILFSDDHFFA